MQVHASTMYCRYLSVFYSPEIVLAATVTACFEYHCGYLPIQALLSKW